ncbi:MAG: hypothetical protein IJO63_02855 [Bacilli bacterium]|nr:hypothetical protein [Bacilli bacterium]
MNKAIAYIKKTISRVNFKSKKVWLLIGFFAVAIGITSSYYSHSYYEVHTDNNLAIGGVAFVSDADIILKIYTENRNTSGTGTGSYTRQYFVPTANYTYNASKSVCTTGIKINGLVDGETVSTDTLDIQATKKGYCKVYFDAVDGVIADVTHTLWVEQNSGAGDYVLMGRIPDNTNTYAIDTTKTSCTGTAPSSITLKNRAIYISATGNFSCDIYVKISATGGTNANLSSTIVGLAGTTGTSSQNGSIYRVADQNGYRYEGKDPDNYVMFNGEVWRIIGAFEGGEIGMLSGKYYTKIIRADSIGSYAWNTVSANSWPSSSLYKYLNGEYYNSIGSVSRDMVVNPSWSIGAVNQNQTGNVSSLYAGERGTVGSPSAPNLVKTAGRVGLVYPSDYLYSVYSESCDNTIISGYGDDTRCFNTAGWLIYGKRDWTITARREASYSMVLSIYVETENVSNSGLHIGNQWWPVTSKRGVRPTVYLDYDVTIVGGGGTKGNPYRLK